MGRKHYTEEFKREAARLLEVSARPIPEIAADPGVRGATLRPLLSTASADRPKDCFDEQPQEPYHLPWWCISKWVKY